MTIKQGGVLNRVDLGVPFLGFTLYPDRIRLNAPGRRRLRRRCRELARTLHREDRDPFGREVDSLAAQFAHASFADDLAWRRSVCDRLETLWERQGTHEPRPSRRLLEQYGEELPRRVSQQEPSDESQQEHRLPPLRVLRHGETRLSPDDAFSSAPEGESGEKSRDRRPPLPEIQGRMAEEKGTGEAAAAPGGEAER